MVLWHLLYSTCMGSLHFHSFTTLHFHNFPKSNQVQTRDAVPDIVGHHSRGKIGFADSRTHRSFSMFPGAFRECSSCSLFSYSCAVQLPFLPFVCWVPTPRLQSAVMLSLLSVPLIVFWLVK